MITLSIIKTNPDWLEATWSEVKTVTLPQNEISDDVVDLALRAQEATEVIWCESYSGHREHIDMLVNKAIEFGTDLTDGDKELIKQVSEAYVYPTEEEIQAEVVTNKIAECKVYLANTDYKVTVDYFATLTEAEQQDLIAKRAEAREYIRSNS